MRWEASRERQNCCDPNLQANIEDVALDKPTGPMISPEIHKTINIIPSVASPELHSLPAARSCWEQQCP